MNSRYIECLCFLACATCARTPPANLAERLDQFPSEAAQAPESDVDELLRRSLEDELEGIRIQMPRDLPILVLRGENVTARILPANVADRFVLLTDSELAALTRDYGKLRYVSLEIHFESPDHARVTVGVDLSVPPNTFSLCCGGRIFHYRRRDGAWIPDSGIRQFFD